MIVQRRDDTYLVFRDMQKIYKSYMHDGIEYLCYSPSCHTANVPLVG